MDPSTLLPCPLKLKVHHYQIPQLPQYFLQVSFSKGPLTFLRSQASMWHSQIMDPFFSTTFISLTIPGGRGVFFFQLLATSRPFQLLFHQNPQMTNIMPSSESYYISSLKCITLDYTNSQPSLWLSFTNLTSQSFPPFIH